MNTQIYGIIGAIHHGKTTLADAIANEITKLEASATRHESSQIIGDHANTILTILDRDRATSLEHWLQLTNMSVISSALPSEIPTDSEEVLRKQPHFEKLFQYIDSEQYLHGPIVAGNKDKHRGILQWLGGYVTKYDTDYWFGRIVHDIRDSNADIAIVGGARYPSDEAVLREAGAKMISITRPDLAEEDTADVTERERSNITVDCTVLNNGSIEDLQILATAIAQDMLAGNLKTSYSAK